MVMETPSPQCIGQEFVRQYYTILHEVPDQLHRFYSHDSCFVHGGVDKPGETNTHVQGQHDIHQKIMSLNFHNCYVKIGQVDSQPTVGNAVVVQVTGELSNDGQPMRRFMQTFVLVSQSPKKYYVHNDIFRYQDEVFADTESDNENVDEGPDGESEPVEPSHTMMDTTQMTPAPQPPTIYYEAPPQPPLSNGTAHIEEPEVTVAPSEDPAPVVMMSAEEEPKEVFEPPQPAVPEVAPEPEREPSPEPEPQAKVGVPPAGNRTWAAMLQGGSGGSGPVAQAPPPVAKPAAAPVKPQAAPSDVKPMDGAGGPPQPQRLPRAPRDRGARDRDGSRHNETGGEEVRRLRPQFSDNLQVFVGNLPHTMSDKDLKEFFAPWGKVVDLRINKKGSSISVPNYGFVVFEDENSVQNILKNKGNFMLKDGHRINVEEKKQRGEGGRPGSGTRTGGRGGPMMGRGGMGEMGWGRGGGQQGRGGSDSGRGGPPRRGGFGAPRR